MLWTSLWLLNSSTEHTWFPCLNVTLFFSMQPCQSFIHLSNVEATEWNCSVVEWEEDRARSPAAWGDGVRLWPFFRVLVGAGGAGSGRLCMLRLADRGRSSISSATSTDGDTCWKIVQTLKKMFIDFYKEIQEMVFNVFVFWKHSQFVVGQLIRMLQSILTFKLN